MADHFAMVGFTDVMTSPAKLEAYTEKVVQRCDPVTINDLAIVCEIKDPSGAEVRVGLKKVAGGGEVVTINPAFKGTGHVRIQVVSDVSSTEYAPFEVRLSARFAGEETPLVVELADPREASKLKVGAKATIAVSAFSFEPQFYADEAAFDGSQKNLKVHFAPDYFIPSGMFVQKLGGAADDKGPTAYADFAGKIEKAELRSNAAGGGKFWWLSVRTYSDSTFDVVLDPKSVKRAPLPGQIVSGRYWLSARLVSVD